MGSPITVSAWPSMIIHDSVTARHQAYCLFKGFTLNVCIYACLMEFAERLFEMLRMEVSQEDSVITDISIGILEVSDCWPSE